MQKKLFTFLFLLFIPLVVAHETEEKSFLAEHASTILPVAIGALLAVLIGYKIIKKLLFVLMAVIFIGIGILLASYYHESTEPAPKALVGNQQLLDEIKQLQFIIVERNLTLYDLQKADVLMQEDTIARSFVEEMRWLIAHGEPDHAEHSLSFLNTYVKTGDSLFCIPHEIDHVLLFLKYNETERAEETIHAIKGHIPKWVEKAEKGKKSLPQHYKNFEALKEKTILVIDKLAQGNYSEDVQIRAKSIAEDGIC